MSKKIGLLVLALCASGLSFAQLGGQVEAGWNTENSGKSYGVGLQYLIYQDYYFLPGINAGVQYVAPKNGDGYISFPVRLQARYYFFGRHGCSGGAYTEAQAGVQFQQAQPADPETGADAISSSDPLAGVGIGYRSPMSYDYGLQLHTVFAESGTRPVLLFRLGYTF